MRGDLLPKIITDVPGPRSRRLARQLRQYESRNVVFINDSFPIFWERAAGANVWDVDGNRFVDFTAAFGVASTGHTNATVLAAAKKQAGQLLHAMGDVHPVEIRLTLAAELSKLTFERWGAGRGKVLFGSSGSDAVELALKTAAVATGKPGVIAFEGAYHGLGYGALDTTWSAHYRRPFTKQLVHFTAHVPFPRANAGHSCISDTLSKMTDAVRHSEIGAVLVEPIQGRAGIIVPPPEFLSMLRRFCDEHALLLIVDEIYTGFGRTGKWFAVEHSRVVPDLICLGKGMAGGFPISACVGKASVMDEWPESEGDAIHTSTFFGHPVGCAMALAQIEEIRGKKLLERSAKFGQLLLRTLSKLRSPHDGIGEIRGCGLMVGVTIVEKGRARPLGAPLVFDIVTRALQHGVIVLADGIHHNVLGLTPPLTITERQLNHCVETLRNLLSAR